MRERELNRLGRLREREPMCDQVAYLILMSADQTAKRIDIAVEDGSYQFRVRRACHK